MKFDIEMDPKDITEAVAYIQGFFSGARGVVDVPDSVHALTRALKTPCTEDEEPDKEQAAESDLTTTLVAHATELLSILSLIHGMKHPNTEEYFLLGNMIKDLEKVVPSTTAMQEITFNTRPGHLWTILHDSTYLRPVMSVSASNYILELMKQIDEQQKEKDYHE